MYEIVDIDVDWIAGTCPNESIHYNAASKLGYTLLDDSQAAGNELHNTPRYGYGGLKCGQVFFGTRDDGIALQASGRTARQCWRAVAKTFPRLTRLDLCIDIRSAQHTSDTIRFYARDSHEHRTANGLHHKIRFIDGHGSGDTVYVGSMKSEHFIRIYDKYKESGDEAYKDVIRYEVCLRRANATKYGQLLCEQTPAAARETIISFVSSYCSGRGIRFPHRPDLSVNLLPLVKEKRDVDRYKKWAPRQIPISMSKSISYGFAQQLLKVIPLSELLIAVRCPRDIMYPVVMYVNKLPEDD